MNQRLAMIAFLFSFFVVIYVGLIRKEEGDNGIRTGILPSPTSALQPASKSPTQTGRDTNQKPAHTSRTPASDRLETIALSEDQSLSIDRFLRKYGEESKIKRHDSGRILSIVSSLNRPEAFSKDQKKMGFNILKEDSVSERASEILANAREFLGIRKDLPLSRPTITGTTTTVQAVYKETRGGLPLAPGGQITVILGSEGELKALYSDYLPAVEVAEQQVQALTAAPQPPVASRTVYWIQELVDSSAPSSPEPVALLRRAYEVRQAGIQSVFDADTGRILFEKNRQID